MIRTKDAALIALKYMQDNMTFYTTTQSFHPSWHNGREIGKKISPEVETDKKASRLGIRALKKLAEEGLVEQCYSRGPYKLTQKGVDYEIEQTK